MNLKTRNLSDDSPPIRLNVYLENGGLGDQICRLPAVDYILTMGTHLQHVNLFVPKYFIEVAKNALAKHAAKLTVYSHAALRLVQEQEPDTPSVITNEHHHSTLRTHLVDHAFRVLADIDAPPNFRNYLQLDLSSIDLTKFPIPPEYVVITTGFTAPVRQWPSQIVNHVIDHVKKMGYRVVFLGKKQVDSTLKGHFADDINYFKGINLIDKTSLLEAAAIMEKATVVLGVDNGLIHLAGCTNAFIIAGYTSVAPEYRMPIRYGMLSYRVRPIVPDVDLGCRGCQSQTHFNYRHDFRECFYGDYACLPQLRFKKWKEVLDDRL